LHSLVLFFSSSRRHTRCLSDWSSDVCSSDLPSTMAITSLSPPTPDSELDITSTFQRCDSAYREYMRNISAANKDDSSPPVPARRSEERRVGKECRSRGATEAGVEDRCNRGAQ